VTGSGRRRRGVSRLLTWIHRRRRLLSASFVGLAVVFGLGAVRPAPPATGPVLVATHDLVAGQLLDASDLTVRRFPVDLVPAGAVLEVAPLTARRLAGPMRAGEPLTDARLVGPSLLRGLTGQVAVPVHVADAQTAQLVRPGDRVDVVALADDAVGRPLDAVGQPLDSAETGSAGSRSAGGGVLATAALVLAVPALDSSATGGTGGLVGSGGSGTLVVLAVPGATATRLARATAPVTLLLRVTPSAEDTDPGHTPLR